MHLRVCLCVCVCVQLLPVSRQLPAEAGGVDLGAKMQAAMEEVQRQGGGHAKVGGNGKAAKGNRESETVGLRRARLVAATGSRKRLNTYH